MDGVNSAGRVGSDGGGATSIAGGCGITFAAAMNASFSAAAICSASCFASLSVLNLSAIKSALASSKSVFIFSPLRIEIMVSSTKSIARLVSSRFERHRLM